MVVQKNSCTTAKIHNKLTAILLANCLTNPEIC